MTLTNTGDQPLTISTFRLNGPDAADFGLGALCPVNPDQLQPGASCTIYVSFTADSPGAKSATLSIGDDAPHPQTVELSGSGNAASGGTPAATVSPGGLAYGDEIVDVRSGAQAVTLTNSGTGPLSISTFRITGPDAVDFAQGADCRSARARCRRGARARSTSRSTPDSAGSKSANLVIGDDAPGGAQTVAVTGRGSLGAAKRRCRRVAYLRRSHGRHDFRGAGGHVEEHRSRAARDRDLPDLNGAGHSRLRPGGRLPRRP